MRNHSVVITLMMAVLISLSGDTLRAQVTGPQFDEYKRTIAAGRAVEFRFKFNSVTPDGPRSSGIYACCGGIGVYLADGTVTLKNDSAAFHFATAIQDFNVDPSKIVDLSNQASQASRVHLTVMLPGKNGKEKKRELYLYNPAAVSFGDPSVGGSGTSISCSGCDNSMDMLASLIGWLRIPNHAVPTAAPTAEKPATTKTGMTNTDVMKMVSAGLSEQVIITAIRQERSTSFGLTPSALIALKGAHTSDGVIAAMQAKNSDTGTATPNEAKDKDTPVVAAKQVTAPAPLPANPCAGIEMMGLYKVDMRPSAPLIVYQAKVRNGTGLTRIVTIGWLDYYGEEKETGGQIAPGAIATFNLGPHQPQNRQPMNLRTKTCE
jgi:hypothetical protein